MFFFLIWYLRCFKGIIVREDIKPSHYLDWKRISTKQTPASFTKALQKHITVKIKQNKINKNEHDIRGCGSVWFIDHIIQLSVQNI